MGVSLAIARDALVVYREVQSVLTARQDDDKATNVVSIAWRAGREDEPKAVLTARRDESAHP